MIVLRQQMIVSLQFLDIGVVYLRHDSGSDPRVRCHRPDPREGS